MINLQNFVIGNNATILEALELININKKGFLIVVNKEDNVVGTLTDGDIRRSFLRKGSLHDSINNVYNHNFKYLNSKDALSNAIELFKKFPIDFLPIINTNKVLTNLLTKTQLHTLLMLDLNVNLDFDFLTLDESVLDSEIYQRPWGFYKTTLINKYCQSKIICVYPNSKLSLQSHRLREEHWVIAHGQGIVQIEESFVKAFSGSVFFIPKGCKHRLSNTSEKENLILTELQIGNYFGEDDIVRFEDEYGRV